LVDQLSSGGRDGVPDDFGGEQAGEREIAPSSPFFVSRKAAAVLKHEILRQYVVPFVSKVGRNATDRRVVYLDGYAGPGCYDDGTPGSPALVLDSAARVSEFRTLDCVFVEKKRSDFERLSQLVADARTRGISATALHGPVEEHLDDVLARASGAPLLAFLDPFGLGLSFDHLTGRIFGPQRPQNPGGWTATEVLLNFSANAVRRIGGLLTSQKSPRHKPATLAAMDVACGGQWWREEYLNSTDTGEAVERIARGFTRRVCQRIDAGAWTVAVRNGSHQKPVYHLVFFSRHPDGLWLFGEANSLAQEKWRRVCGPAPPPPDPNRLFELEDPFEVAERRLREGWIREIKANVVRLLAEHGSFTIQTQHVAIMGSAIDQAREMHIRAAVKELYREGRTSCTGVGDVRKLFIAPPAAANL
jgi:three-Cys-motif partner protein